MDRGACRATIYEVVKSQTIEHALTETYTYSKFQPFVPQILTFMKENCVPPALNALEKVAPMSSLLLHCQ